MALSCSWSAGGKPRQLWGTNVPSTGPGGPHRTPTSGQEGAADQAGRAPADPRKPRSARREGPPTPWARGQGRGPGAAEERSGPGWAPGAWTSQGAGPQGPGRPMGQPGRPRTFPSPGGRVHSARPGPRPTRPLACGVHQLAQRAPTASPPAPRVGLLLLPLLRPRSRPSGPRAPLLPFLSDTRRPHGL